MLVKIAIPVALLTVALPAAAEEEVPAMPQACAIGTRGRNILSGERLVAVQYWANYEGDYLDVHFLYVAWGLSTPPNPYNLPSLAYDYVVADRVTVGLSGGFITGNKEGSAWIVGVRGGYIWPVSDNVSFWGRAGLGYFETYAGGDSVERATGLFVTLAPQFVFGIGSHFAISLGVTGDLPLTGSHRTRDWFGDGGIIVERHKTWGAIAIMMGALLHF